MNERENDGSLMVRPRRLDASKAPEGGHGAAPAALSGGAPGAARPGVVYLVGAGPGDPGLFTLRGAELLATADVVLHDELVHTSLLDGVREGAEVRSVGKRGGDRVAKDAKQAEIDAELVALGRAGRSVVRLKGGDPFLFGRGSEEAEALARAGVPFEVVPGVCSPLGATAYAGISLTHRNIASSVMIVSGVTRAGKPFDWSELASVRGTICVLMGMQAIDAVVAGLLGPGRREPSTPAAAIQWGTRAEQRVVTTRLDDLPRRIREAGLESPAVLVVGAVTGLRDALRWFDRKPLFGKRVLVTRPRHQARSTSRLIRQRGGEAVELATIEIHPPPDPARVTEAVRGLSGYHLVVFTSENGVASFFGELTRLGMDARAFGVARIAAIGAGTAAALAGRGIRADIIPSEFRGEELAEAILADPVLAERRKAPPPVRVLLPRALVAREVLPERLRAAGCEVDVVPVYETRPAPAERRDELLRALGAGQIDVVLLTSSSTVDSLCDLLGDDAAARLDGVLVASIGPITTATAEKRGLRVGVTAEVSTIPGLLDALDRHLASLRSSTTTAV
ncbi:uroporphyrinogen-III C-methyltransferase [Sorangium sp. So ce1036]|uniref:uroporphyrinogen-III C-methyltransferase n=1 Tax=Sorangium sp. So ce1036 TaxID=3133328 RepID=UPI003F01F309